MYRKKIGIALCLMALASFLVPSMTSAVDSWYVCSVGYVGKNASGELKFRLTEVGGRFTSQICGIADATQANHYMAILLTAQVTTANVGVCTSTAIPVGGQSATVLVTCVYLQQ
ncbi:MAG: hypothetical protein HY788_02860 [Deltaproteobacteria bacterium]|nr:hypothetical protein [Deltaproteobacteria bacterium]